MKQKIINILLYVFAIPIAYIASRLFYIVGEFFGTYTGIISRRLTGAYGMSNTELYIFDCVVCTAIYIFLVHKLVPSYKLLFSIIASILYLIPVAITVISAYIQPTENLVLILGGALLTFIILVVANAYSFMR